MNKLTVVMYHYVRPLKNTRYPKIKGLDFEFFKEQLQFLKRHYHFVTMEEVIDAKLNRTTLPLHSVLLTFDDAYIDHYLYVYPILKKINVQGSFFIPVKAVMEDKILDVNKIHFILAVMEDNIDSLILDIKNLLADYQTNYKLDSFDNYYKNLAIKNRFDNEKIIFVKRLLQVALPEELRNIITSDLFTKYLNISDQSFRNELYMNEDQCRHMCTDGMHFGSHGNNHYWWDKLDSNQLKEEINNSTEFLINLGMNKNYLTCCYPYGSYNETCFSILKDFGYKLAFSTRTDLVDLQKDNPLALSRLDTNDLPKDSNALTNSWYE